MNAKILIVEDNFIASDEVKDRLRTLGYTEIETAFSGEEALEMAERFQPDLILMDINLGRGIDGIETATRIRARRPVPVIYLTAYDDDATLKRAKITEPYAYIIKPFEEREIHIAVEIALYKHETEQALRRAKEAAEAANQAKSQFLANMSHELRTPLNAILGYAQLCMNDESLSEKHRNSAGTIFRSGEHLLAMITDILDFSRIEARRIELFPVVLRLPGFLNELVDMVRIRAYRKQITFIFDLAPDIPNMIMVDDKRLRQILLNLLSNAVKFTEQGNVAFRVTKATNAAQVEGDRRIVNLQFSIQDTGPGIPPDRLDTIFEPFQRGGEHQAHIEGTGLGLAISRELAHLMGGKLTVESTLGVGSTFQFAVSVQEIFDEQSAPPRPSRNIIGFRGEPHTILIADDTRANRDVLREMLTQIGFHVIEAANGRETIEKASAVSPDIILMDVLMPDMDGIAATQRIRSGEAQQGSSRRIVILGISANVFDETRRKCLEAGCDDFLVKPVRLQDLLMKIGRHLPIEWLYAQENVPPAEPKTPQPLVLPPEQDLRRLLEASNSGDIMAVREWLDRFETLDPAYHPFIKHARELAKVFRLQEIRKYVEEQLSE